MSPTKPILITGASSGIGAATAARLAARGYRVYATARNPQSLSALADKGCKTLALDVTDEDSMLAAVAAIEAAEGPIGALINNAGYSQTGALQTLSLADVRRQFETNVFGLLRLTQLVLPGMRRARAGRIINISSMGGMLTFPGGGAYHATKYAVEALSDALRFEVSGFGVDVVVIQPGLIRTGFAEVAAAGVAATAAGDPFDSFNAEVARITREAYVSGVFAKLGGEPEDVAKVIETALAARKPKTRYAVTPSAHILMTLRRILSDRLWDRFLGTTYPQPGKAR